MEKHKIWLLTILVAFAAAISSVGMSLLMERELEWWYPFAMGLLFGMVYFFVVAVLNFRISKRGGKIL
jgi:uncharacterized membrane protein